MVLDAFGQLVLIDYGMARKKTGTCGTLPYAAIKEPPGPITLETEVESLFYCLVRVCLCIPPLSQPQQVAEMALSGALLL